MNLVSLIAAAAALCDAATPASAAPPTLGTLDSLSRPRPEGARLAHYSSRAPDGSNRDFVNVAPGKTVTLLEHAGPGTLRRLWLTVAPRNNAAIQRQAILRCYWDGEASPSVEVPLSDFFGMGFGEWRDFQSLPLNMTSGGYNCYWPMPFWRSARVTLENRSPVSIDALYWNAAVETRPKADEKSADRLYFHAQFRRTNPTKRGEPVTLLEATGRGHYVGTLLSMQNLRGRALGFLEGDERVFVDGEREPSVIGTGTEDYFSSGWYYDTGAYSAAYHGVTIKDTERGRISTYRWHIEDPIPFTKSLRFTIEHGGTNDAPNVDYSSVTYWYQTHPHAPFPPLPADLMPVEGPRVPKVPGMIEGESLRAGAKATTGALEVQDMAGFDGDWSGLSQLWWRPAAAGARLTLALPAPPQGAGRYRVVGWFTRAPDYGDVSVSVNGARLSGVVRGYAPAVTPTGAVTLGEAALGAGENRLELEVTGKDARATGFLIGLDGFTLERVEK